MSKRNKIPMSRLEMVRQEENRKARFIQTFPARIIKFFAGVVFFIPLTMISFGVVCFQRNEWPWSEQI